MRHLLMDPAFPDIVGQWAAQQDEISSEACTCVNDNGDEGVSEPSNPFLTMLGKLKVAAAGIW